MLFIAEEGLFGVLVTSVVTSVCLVGRKCDCAKQTYAEQTLIIAMGVVGRACA